MIPYKPFHWQVALKWSSSGCRQLLLTVATAYLS